VAEDAVLKKEIYARFLKHLKPHTIVASGTSGLSINSLSEPFSDEQRRRFLGIHMFNPPYRMTLCEVIPSQYTGRDVVANMKTYLTDVLYRDVVEVRDAPAFLGNRIGFQFINEALQYAEALKDSGGIDYIDCFW